jgi:LacI family transcriptional regulator
MPTRGNRAEPASSPGDEEPPPKRGARVTAHDVARLAGVSQPTVSLVLSGNPKARVAEATRERVRKAASELGYRPNVLARALVRRRSFALGIIVPDLANPFFADVVIGVERVAAGADYAVLLCEAAETAADRHLEALVGRQIDGIIIDAGGAATLPRDLVEGLPVVLIDKPSEDLPGVASDALRAGSLAAEHLISLGHRRLAFIGPATDTWAFRMRERGFTQALRAAGAPLSPEDVRRAPATTAGGFNAMKDMLSRRDRPTAVFLANDLMALGALKAAARTGVRVPDDISIMGCDDIEMSRLVNPELTTVTVRARELGARAARLLLRVLAGDTPKSSALVPVTLAVRGTTARLQST